MPKLSLFFDNKQPNTCLWALHSELKSQKNLHITDKSSIQNFDTKKLSIFYPLVLIDFKECKPFQTYCYANILGSVEGLSRDVSLVYIKNTKNCSICKCFGSLYRKSVWTFITSNNFEFLDMTDSTVYKLKKILQKQSSQE